MKNNIIIDKLYISKDETQIIKITAIRYGVLFDVLEGINKGENLALNFDDFNTYFTKVEISKDNIALYYEFMSDEDLEKYKEIISDIILDRFENLVFSSLQLDYADCKRDIVSYYWCSSFHKFIIGGSVFGIKDTLKPIDEYIADIKGSSEYKEYINISSFKSVYDDDVAAELNNSFVFKTDDEARDIFKAGKVELFGIDDAGHESLIYDADSFDGWECYGIEKS